jgi:transposase
MQAHLARTDFFKPVHVKSLPAHAIRSLIIARKKLVGLALASLLKLKPGFTIKALIETGARFSDNPVYAQQIARMAEGLRKAGLPEE